MSLLGTLGTLESAGLIRLAQLRPELEYLFRHALVQDAAYASILEQDRRRLHRQVGEAVERLYSDRLDEQAAVLAHHFDRAGDRRRALTYYRRAAHNAVDTYANHEAETYCRSGLALADTPDARIELLENLGLALNGQSRFEEAIDVWREAIDLCVTQESWATVARLYARASRAAWMSGDTGRGLVIAEEGLDRLEDAPESGDLARLLHEAARAYFFNGRPEKVRALCERALSMAEAADAVDVQADTLTTLSLLRDQPAEQKVETILRAIQLAEASGRPVIASRAHHNAGVAYSGLLGDVAQARYHLEKAVSFAQLTGVAQQEMISLTNLLGAMIKTEGPVAAQPYLERAEQLARSLPDPELAEFDLLGTRLTLTWLRADYDRLHTLGRDLIEKARAGSDLQMEASGVNALLGAEMGRARRRQPADLAAAERHARRLLELAERGMAKELEVLCSLAIIRSLQGRADEAGVLLGEARAAAGKPASYWDRPSLLDAEMEVARAEGRYDEAIELAEELAGIWDSAGLRGSWVHSLEHMALLLEERGRTDDLRRAQALLREGITTARSLGLPELAERMEEEVNEVRAALFRQAAAHERAAGELQAARRTQASLLPSKIPQREGWDLAARLQPARETSGDFYDFVELADGRLGFLVADVADKGAGAALYMAMARTYLRGAFRESAPTPAGVLARANEQILTETGSDLFATVFVGILDPEAGELAYANAGHNPPLLLANAATDHVQRLTRTGMAVGVLRDARWESRTLTLGPGATLLLYTDGVTEAHDEENGLFGEPRLEHALLEEREKPAAAILTALFDRIGAFVGDAPPSDDITILVLQR